jgi:hypothetical protein
MAARRQETIEGTWGASTGEGDATTEYGFLTQQSLTLSGTAGEQKDQVPYS